MLDFAPELALIPFQFHEKFTRGIYTSLGSHGRMCCSIVNVPLFTWAQNDALDHHPQLKPLVQAASIPARRNVPVDVLPPDAGPRGTVR